MSTTLMTGTHWTNALKRFGACDEAVAWARGYESLAAAWAACERGDWMLWLLARVAQQGSPEHQAAVATACACARRALRFVPTSELQPAWHAIELAERWAQGETVSMDALHQATVSLDDLRRARRAAYAAVDVAAADAAAAAVDAAVDAAADAAAYAATAVDAAATAAAYAAAAAAAAAADAAYMASAAEAATDAAAAAAKAERAAIADLIRERHVAPVPR